MFLRKLLAIAGLVIGAVFLAPGIATAQPYPAAPPTLTSFTSTVFVGQTFGLRGRHFGAYETITLTASCNGGPSEPIWHISTATKRNGKFASTVRLFEVGTCVITATGNTTGVSASTVIQVLPQSENGGPGPAAPPANQTVQNGPVTPPAPLEAGAGGALLGTMS
jgi:hypothetical protein